MSESVRTEDIPDSSIASTYRTILACYRNPCSHDGMRAYTERSLFSAHKELARRNLPRAVDDDTNPDEFAGYSDLMIAGHRLRDILDAQAMRDLLGFAWEVRTNRIAMSAAQERFWQHRDLFFTAGLEVQAGVETMCAAIEEFHGQPPPAPPPNFPKKAFDAAQGDT